jgi:hypothetical protein
MGDFPEDPIDTSHPDISVGTRQLINFAGGDPKTAERYLQGKGYDAKAIGGFNFAVKKPEETKWQRLDSTKWEWQDVLDVVGDALSLGGMVVGGLGGTSAGGPVGGVAGSAAGAAGAQGVRSTVGQLLGMPTTQEEALGSIGREAATGALAEVGGRVIGATAKGILGKIRGKPPAPRAAEKVAGIPTTRQGMVEAIEKLGPQEKFGVEFTELGAKGGGHVFGEFQKLPPLNKKLMSYAQEQAEYVAGKGKWARMSVEETTEDIYTRMLHGEMPAAGAGRVGPFVDVAKREAQVAAENPELVKTIGTEITRRAPPKLPQTRGGETLWAATATKGMKKFLNNTAIPHNARLLLQKILVEGPDAVAKNLPLLTEHLAYLGKQGKLPAQQAHHWALQAEGLVKSWATKVARGKVTGKQQMVRPLGDTYWTKIPTGSDVAFWRDIPAEGIKSLTLPDGTLLSLTIPQGKAVKVIVHSAATDNWTPRAKKLLKGLIAGLKKPRELIVSGLQAATNAHVGKFMRKHPFTGNVGLGAAETLIGGAAGGWTGLAVGMDVAGRGIEKVFGSLLRDTSGGALRGLFKRSTLGVPEALKKAAQAAGAGNEELYRAIMWTALKQTDVNEYLQATAGSRGVNAEGPRVRQGHGS